MVLFSRRCLELSSEKCRDEYIVLSTCLVPAQSIGVLSYVMEFLSEIASYSGENRMTAENLAIVMGPNVMPVDQREQRKHEKVKEGPHQPDRHTLDQHNKVVEVNINITSTI
jgi:homoaconitase/3-isopropylmalate dehydratase large subunit